jgi:hypothetical protein
MVAGTHSTEATAPRPLELRPLLWGAAFLLGIGALQRAAAQFTDNPMTQTMLGAVVVSMVAGRAELPNEGASRGARQRGLRGALLGSIPVVAALAATLAAGGSIEAGAPAAAMFFGVVEAAALAYRDELWLHGMVLAFAMRGGVPKTVAAGYAVSASMAATALLPRADIEGVLLTGAASTLFVALWLRGRDAWAPIAAHFAWAWLVDGALAGDLLDVRFASGRLTHEASARGLPAWVASATFVALALSVLRGIPSLPALETEHKRADAAPEAGTASEAASE